MKRAIELARNGQGFTSPNPCVGAVVVKGDEIVAEGWHKKAGEDHAEIIAIKEIMRKSGIVSVDVEPALFHNATLYVTLEPCSHEGKTPSCAKAIVAAGFKKVCIGMKDPFLKVNGKGIKYLKKCGVDVELCKVNSLLVKEIASLNQPFIKWVKEEMPYVTLKAGMTLDAKIATEGGDSKWITSDSARRDAKIERSICDAILVGSGTVSADDPTLGTAGKYSAKPLLRVIVDSKLNLDLASKVFRDEHVLVACSDAASIKNKNKFKKAGVEFKSFGKTQVSFTRLLKFLAKRGVQNLFVEGGSSIHGAFFDDGLVDRVLFYVAPKLLGGKNSKPVIGGIGMEKISRAVDLNDLEVKKIGDDLKLEAFVNFY